ncbi:MAG: hypothetical protein A3J79_08340 [Elusimicrobia bacterium RIFOXYB2_FULL_62_6]|nr:MAG: hypothetical protein A3J79_08340 [Elusimicrobia bacterium RIFOXYB2_FULL_62_6]
MMKKLLGTIFAVAALLPFINPSAQAAVNLDRLLDSLASDQPGRSGGPDTLAALRLEAGNPRSARAMLHEVFSRGKSAGYKCSLIDALGASRDEGVIRTLAMALEDADEGVRVCAARSLGEQKNPFAVDMLVKNVEVYLAGGGRGHYEADIKRRLAAINAIWSLGEIGEPAVMNKLRDFYAESDDVIKINILISIGKLKKNAAAAPYLRAIAASTSESETVRAAAFEMLGELKEEPRTSLVVRSRAVGIEKGDMIYTGGIVGTISGWFMPDMPVGHAGVFTGTAVENGRIKILITDCVPNNFKPGGVRNIESWKNFTHHFMYPYYGNRTTSPRPTAEQRVKIVARGLELGKKGLKYTNTHIPQKGPEVFDCVGYVEYLYEQAGLNPTPDKLETDWGWPLTPSEQFDATVANTHTPLIIVAPQAIYIPTPEEIAATSVALPLDFVLVVPDKLPLN